MMKLAVFSLPHNAAHAKQLVATIRKDKFFKVVTTQPDVVVSVGGDGTFFFAERKFPGVPKLLVRQSKICHKCEDYSFDVMLTRLKQKRYSVETLTVLESRIGKRRWFSVNDVIVRNKNIQHALRFSVRVNRKMVHPRVIGDGVVISTPYGSTAYFHAITGNSFSKGVGLAFNNTTGDETFFVVHASPIFEIKISREEGVVAFDNNPRTVVLTPGDTLTIKKSEKVAKVLHF